MTDTRPRAARTAALPLLRKAAAYEVVMWRSLYRWVLRRPLPREAGTEDFGYSGAVTPILTVFIVLSVIEIPVLDLILRHVLPWDGVRLAALAVGVYGVLWMIGLMASLRVHPHTVGPAGLRLRNGGTLEVTVPWDAVAAVRKRHRSLPSSRAVQVEQVGDATILHLGGNQTSVDVVLRRPVRFDVPRGPEEPVAEVRFYADDPDALVARARRHLPAAETP